MALSDWNPFFSSAASASWDRTVGGSFAALIPSRARWIADTQPLFSDSPSATRWRAPAAAASEDCAEQVRKRV